MPTPLHAQFALFFFLLLGATTDVTVLTEAAALVAAAQDLCAPHLYASDCLATPGCHWCCDAVFGRQCVAANSSSRSSASHHFESGVVAACAAEATLTLPSQSCETRCWDMGRSCTLCASQSWCYFCEQSGHCQAPQDACPGHSITRKCEHTAPDATPTPKWRIIALVALGMVVAAVVPALVYGGWRLGQCASHVWRRRRARREQHQPLLGPVTGEAPTLAAPRDGFAAPRESAAATAASPAMSSRPSTVLDDDSVCYLCLAARPSVTFLPCYHTCSCEACSNRLRPVGGAVTCPFCRRTVEAMVSLTRLLKDGAAPTGSARVAEPNAPHHD